MPSGTTLRKLSSLTLLALFMIPAACGKKPAVVPPPAPPTAQPPNQPPPPPPAPPRENPPVPPPTAPVAPPDEVTYKESVEKWLGQYVEDVFFDLDVSELSDRARATLSKGAEYLKKDYAATLKVSIEGHADARGTSEYNLALGDRRAAAVRDYLVSLGIAAARLTTISLGEERPVCTEENEVCWARNRRAHFIVAR